MIVIYASWRVMAEDRAEYDRWFSSKILQTHGEPGCLVYEYFINPLKPERGYNFEVWQDQASLEAHLLSDAHIEIVRDNSGRWKSEDFECTFFDDAGEWRTMKLNKSTDTLGIHGLGEHNAAEAELRRRIVG